MRPNGHAFPHRPRFTLGLRLGASVFTRTRPRKPEGTSLKQQAKTEPRPNAVRTKPWHRFCLCLVGFLFSLAQVHAQSLDLNRHISQYGHTAWRTQEGVVAADADLTQTADGYVWIRTAGHFMRFDGAQFLPWQAPKDFKWPQGSSITYLLGSTDGSLWIGTSGGLIRLKNGQLSTYGRSGISKIIEDQSGRIWLTRYRVPKGEGALCEVDGSALHCYGPSDGLPATFGVGLTEDLTGALWVGGNDLYSWKPGTQAKRHLNSIKHPVILDLATDRSGNVWAAMNGAGPNFGVRCFRSGTWGDFSAARFHSSTLNPEVIFVDRAGAVWIGTENDGLYRIWDGAVDHFSKSDGLSGRRVSLIYQDLEGNLWVSTDGGIDMFRNTPVITYSTDEGLTSNADSVLVSSDGAVWAGAYEGESWNEERHADVLQPGTHGRFSLGPTLPGKIGAMFQDHSGALWFGSGTDLAVYEHGKVEKVLAEDGHVLRPGLILSILEEPTDTVLALSKAKLLRIKDRRLVEAVSLPDGFRLPFLIANPKGGTFIGVGARGLMLYENGIIQDYPLPSANAPTGITDIIADSADSMLLATINGLFHWDGNQMRVLNEESGLPCNRLTGLIKDHRGTLWIQSRCGLLKIERPEFEKWRQNSASSPRIAVFDAVDGAQTGRNFNIWPTMSLAPDGKLWFSNGHTIQMIDPEQIYKNLLPPPVHIEQLISDNKSYQAPAQLRVPANPHNVEIDYTALSFSLPQRVQFRYLLEGRDKTWQGPVTRRQAFYTDLPPGQYRFHVVASNNSGVWNEVGDTASFVVEPAFYQTIWFKAVIAIAVVGSLWALYLFRLKQATATVQNRLLAQMEERERIARELHDTLLQGFQGITLRVQGVAKNIPTQDQHRKMLDDVLDRADELLREARQRVRNLRRRTTDENDLADRLTKYGEELSKDHTATFTLAIVGEPKVLESTVQDEAYRIVGEALTNAFRHASASKIETEVTYDSSALRIRVRDDGVGIDKAVLSNGQPDHWGLNGMRERARAIRAELNIWSREAAGTEVELVIPASIAYPRGEVKAS
jgi:signal transduction histidine kinase/ligand-binding sensor domain-containing protein